jgi:hypothetical protein
MKITLEQSSSFEITEDHGTFTLLDSSNQRKYSFKESYEAVWFAIEIIRNLSFDTLSEHALERAAKMVNTSLPQIPRALLSSIKRERINKTYYDQVFLKILSQLRSGAAVLSLESKADFVLHELVHLLRKSLDPKQATPAFSVA